MTLFAKIIDREIPADIVYEDDRCLAFRDINPIAPVHVLVIPKKPIVGIGTMDAAEAALVGHLMWVCAEVARQEGIADDGFRVVTNNGNHGGQSVYHLHLHVLGGRQLTWPPG